jgi:hypothetical protein
LLEATHNLSVDSERDRPWTPVDAVGMEVGHVQGERDRREFLHEARIAEPMHTPISISAVPPRTPLPNTSTTQISRLRSGWSSMPDIQKANIERAVTTPRIRTSIWPYNGAYPQKVGCSSRTSRQTRNGCCPIVLPGWPEKLPD